MITRAEIEKLGALHAVEPTMLSLYLAVPPSADLSALTARAGELIAAAEAASGRVVEPRARARVRDKLAACARDWPGRTVAVFACAGSGLLEAILLPCSLPERGVLGVRPHIRPLLLARQRCPAFRVAVADQRRLWLFSVDGGDVEGTWIPAAGHDDAAGQLAWIVRDGEPLVIGGPENGADLRARRLAADIVAMPPGRHAAAGLPACLAAVSAGVASTLIVPAEGLVPGYECGRCGTLSLEADTCCPDWGTAALAVPDVIEEMVSRVLEDGGEVVVTGDGTSAVAAWLTVP